MLPGCASANASVPELFGLPEAAALTDPTHLTWSGHLQTFAPLALLQVPGAATLTSLKLDQSEIWKASNGAGWARAAADARAGRRLKVVVLGTSPTAGCGSAEDVLSEEYSPGQQHNRSVGHLKLCDPTRSWGRHLRDFLVRLLGTSAPDVEISPKSAAAANYFGRCTSSRVPKDTHIVLLEVLTNVFGSDLAQLLRAVRHAAPSAATAFVMWPNFNGLFRYDANRASMLAAAESEGADAVDFKSLILAMRMRNPKIPSFYAQDGRDLVHPNPSTHQLLGAVMAHHIARRLADAHRIECAPVGRENGQHARTNRGPRAARNEIRAENESAAFETCYDSAELLPVQPSSAGFELVDEGGDKGVRKMGYVSHTVGGSLLLGPLPIPPERQCAMAAVSVGYLLSTQRKGQGAFRIGCEGCSCTAIHNPFQKELYPYPIVQTDASLASSPVWRKTNVTITAVTEWWALIRAETSCYVRLTHLAHADQPSGAVRRTEGHPTETPKTNRIRIDSMSVVQLDSAYLGYASRHGNSAHKAMARA